MKHVIDAIINKANLKMQLIINVIFYMSYVKSNIEKLKVDGETRRKLRLIALVHDTFKFDEHKGYPRDWSKHHAVLSRDFLAQFTQDETLLKIT